MTTIWKRRTVYATLGLVALLAGAGCLSRGEKIIIARDGAVTIEIEYEGDAGHFEGPDALPSRESGWDVTRKVESKKDSDDKKVKLTGKRVFPPKADLPRNYAAPGDPDADLYLDFPTTVRIEQRADGTYYHFRRLYTPRRWAYVNLCKEAIFEDDVKNVAEKSPEELTRDECLRLLQAFAELEAFKQLEFAREALSKCDPKLPAECWLHARRALLEAYDTQIDWEKLFTTYTFKETKDKEQRDRELQEEAERILRATYNALLASLRRDAGYDDAKIAAFEKAYKRAQRYYEITDSHELHVFDIEVVMPGEIVAHNGESAKENDPSGMSEGVNPSWAFNGPGFRDRPYELLAISRVPRAQKED